MADVQITQTVSALTTGTVAKTMQMITAPANHAVLVERIEVGFDGTSTTGPQVLVEVVKGAITGGSGSSTANPVKRDAAQDETVQTTGVTGYTSEPTGGTTLYRQYVHPQGKHIFVLDRARGRIKGGESLAVRCTVGTAVNYAGTIDATE